jgi:transcriptional regulator with XRE-family HTH domain
MAKLFDFLDLQGNTGAWDFAGAAAQGVQQGMKSGADMAANDYGTLAKFEELALKKKQLEKKDEKDPLDVMKKIQELNTMPIKASEDDYRVAATEMFGEEFQGKELSKIDMDKLGERALQIANASIPEPDIENPLPYIQARLLRTGLRSDAEEKELAAIRQQEREWMRQEHQDKKQARQFDFQAEENRKSQEQMAERLGIKLSHVTKEKEKDRGVRRKERDEALAQTRGKELDVFVGSTGAGKIKKNDKAARDLLSRLQAIREADPDVFKQKAAQYQELLNSPAVKRIRDGAKSAPQSKVTGPADKKKARVRFIKENGIMKKVVD